MAAEDKDGRRALLSYAKRCSDAAKVVASTRQEFDRLCPFCRVRWTAIYDTATGEDTRSCQHCGADGFLTMNAGDIGTAYHLHDMQLTLRDFKRIGDVVESPPPNDQASK